MTSACTASGDPVPGTPQAVARLRTATLFVMTTLLLTAGCLMVRFEIQARSDGAFWPILLMSTLLFGGWLVRRTDPASPPALAAIGAGLAFLASSGGAALRMLVLGLECPQADEMLRSADAYLGMDAVSVIRWTTGHPALVTVLRYAYSSSLPMLLLSIIALGLSGRAVAMWRTCFMYIGTLLVTCLISGLVPAKGSFVGVSEVTQALLPEGAGTYAFQAFESFHASHSNSISFSTLSGVACFPSFHTTAAFIFAQAWWDRRESRPFLGVWLVTVVFSTIPMGGSLRRRSCRRRPTVCKLRGDRQNHHSWSPDGAVFRAEDIDEPRRCPPELSVMEVQRCLEPSTADGRVGTMLPAS